MAGILKKQKVASSGQAKGTMSLKSSKLSNPKHKKQSIPQPEPESEEEDDQSSSGEELDLDGPSEAESESESEIEGSDSDDEVEGDASSSEEDSSEDENAEDDDYSDLMKKKKSKNADGSAEFSSAVNALLDTRLKAYDRKDPILVRSKKQMKELENDKLEQKAKRMLLFEKKQRLTANRKKDILPTNDEEAREVLEKEKKFRKVAQRGVIKLFNAILMTQTETTKEMSKDKIIGETKKKELLNEISKEKFLDLVQAAGKTS